MTIRFLVNVMGLVINYGEGDGRGATKWENRPPPSLKGGNILRPPHQYG